MLEKVIITPEKKWWQFWIKKHYEAISGVDFTISNGTINFFKAPPKGNITYDYIYEESERKAAEEW